MALKINGWQRLWIVLSVLYLFPVIAVAVSIWPKSTHIEKRFLNKTFELIYEFEGKNKKDKISNIVEEANRRGLFNNPKDEKEELMAAENWVALAELAIVKHKGKIKFSEVRNTYEMELKKVTAKRKRIVLFSPLIWFLPVVVLYILGLSVRWIIRGFKQKGNK